MRYLYKCNNNKCETNDVVVDKPISESGRVETCPSCKQTADRVFKVNGIVTGDGVK